MKPYYADDAVTIYHGDCRDILPTLSDDLVAATDPPYGVGKADWDDVLPLDLLALIEHGALTSQNVEMWQSEHPSFRKHGLIEPNVRQITLHHRTTSFGRESLTLVSESRFRLLRRNNNIKRPVQPSARGAQPLDPDVDRPPSLLVGGLLPFIDRRGEVQRATVTEVEPRPPSPTHVCFGKPHALIVGEWSR